jgi:hypothetical protein
VRRRRGGRSCAVAAVSVAAASAGTAPPGARGSGRPWHRGRARSPSAAWHGRKKQVDQQPLDRPWIMRDPAVAIDHGRAVLQPVEGALAGQRRATPVSGLEPPQHHAKHRIVPQLIVIDQVFVAERDAQHLTRVETSCTTRSPARPSTKHPANRSISPIARSVAPSSNAPAFEVIAPPAKSATTRRPSTGAKASALALHSVGIGEPSCVSSSLCRRSTFARSGPQCTYPR